MDEAVIVQCPHCGFVWAPYKRWPNWCPQCKRRILPPRAKPQKSAKPLAYLSDHIEIVARKGPSVLSEPGDLVILEIPVPCDICGKPHRRLVKIGKIRYCKDCIRRLLEDEEIDLFEP